MTQYFDAYHRWLGIAPKHQPPTYYRLLGIEEFESDPEVIADAAERQIAHVRRYALGQHAALSQQILNELSQAKGTLLDPGRKAAYDAQLQAMQPAMPSPQPTAYPTQPTAYPTTQPMYPSVPPTAAFTAPPHMTPPAWQDPTPQPGTFATPIPRAQSIPAAHVSPAQAAGHNPYAVEASTATAQVQQGYARRKSVADKAKRRKKVRFISLAMHVVASILGLIVGYSLLCYVDIKYDFLGLMDREPEQQGGRQNAALTPTQPGSVSVPQQAQTASGTTPLPKSMTGRRAGETRNDNGLNLTLVWCLPGEFTIGSPTSEPGRQPSESQVKVLQLHGYWLGQTEVTQAQWQDVMHTVPWLGKSNVRTGPDFPAVYVSWDDAMQFCQQLTQQERQAGRLPAGWEYSLPTESQWEFACRAGTKTAYHFGSDNRQLSQYAWYSGNAFSRGERYPHQVAQKLSNPWGLHDMHGNVREWCLDWFAPTMASGINPVGPASGTKRVARGGSWAHASTACRSATRVGIPPSQKDDHHGFRVALVRTRPQSASNAGRP